MGTYLKTARDFDEHDTQLNLKHYISKFSRFERAPGNYSIKDNSEIVYTKADRPGTLQLGFDDIMLKTKLILKRIGESFEILRFSKINRFKNIFRF